MNYIMHQALCILNCVRSKKESFFSLKRCCRDCFLFLNKIVGKKLSWERSTVAALLMSVNSEKEFKRKHFYFYTVNCKIFNFTNSFHII